jgi:transposase
MKKQDFRKVDKETRFNIRKRAIALVKNGCKQCEVAKIFGVTNNTVTNWVKSHNKEGEKGLIDSKRGVKSEDKKLLSSEQELAIQNIIIDKMPNQLKLPFALWTRKAVKDLIERKYGIKMAINTAGDYLRSWGFSPQRPKKRAYEQNNKAVKKWLAHEYPKIKKRAKDEYATIHWGDETGIRNTTNYGRSYSPKGQTPTQIILAKRLSLNMISSITNQGKVEFMIYSSTMNSERFLKFLRQLVKNKDRKIFLIVDNLKVHHSKIVTEWVKKNNRTIELFFLPSYSPEKNPDEYLNCDLKLSLSNCPSPKSNKELETNLKNHMDMLSGNKQRVRNYFKHPDAQYAA